MDDLTYTYNGNKLLRVKDIGSNEQGFQDTVDTGAEYIYDANGNMIEDLNKGITSITYNHLNLPVSMDIDGGTIDYVYDAAGTKLKKTVSMGGNTEYCGNYIYEKGQLQFFSTPTSARPMSLCQRFLTKLLFLCQL